MARSQRLPRSSVPTSPSRPSARAASRVTPAIASSTVSRNNVAAMFMISSSEVTGEVPGLLSVAIAIGTPLAAQCGDRRQLRLAQHIERAGQQHRRRCRSRHRSDAVLIGVFQMIGRERAIARQQAARRAGWRADRRAASPASPARLAASNTRAVCCGEKAMPSQNASTASASFSLREHSESCRRPDRCRRPCHPWPPAAAHVRRGTRSRPRRCARGRAGARRAACGLRFPDRAHSPT